MGTTEAGQPSAAARSRPGSPQGPGQWAYWARAPAWPGPPGPPRPHQDAWLPSGAMVSVVPAPPCHRQKMPGGPVLTTLGQAARQLLGSRASHAARVGGRPQATSSAASSWASPPAGCRRHEALALVPWAQGPRLPGCHEGWMKQLSTWTRPGLGAEGCWARPALPSAWVLPRPLGPCLRTGGSEVPCAGAGPPGLPCFPFFSGDPHCSCGRTGTLAVCARGLAQVPKGTPRSPRRVPKRWGAVARQGRGLPGLSVDPAPCQASGLTDKGELPSADPAEGRPKGRSTLSEQWGAGAPRQAASPTHIWRRGCSRPGVWGGPPRRRSLTTPAPRPGQTRLQSA